jgi:hypothetical protein
VLPEDFSSARIVISKLKYSKSEDLPMIDEKKTSELVETWLVYLLSAAVAVGAFLLVWLISTLAALNGT